MQGKRTLAVLALVMAAGCSGLVTDQKSEEARLTVTGESPVDIRIVTSTRFGFYVDPATSQTRTLLQESDTLDLQPPYDERFDISRYGIFLVRVINSDTARATINVSVSIDGDTKLDQDLVIAADDEGNVGSYEWAYVQ